MEDRRPNKRRLDIIQGHINVSAAWVGSTRNALRFNNFRFTVRDETPSGTFAGRMAALTDWLQPVDDPAARSDAELQRTQSSLR